MLALKLLCGVISVQKQTKKDFPSYAIV